MADFDLVLRNGVVLDGTGGRPLRADVGVAGDRIASVGASLRGRQALDCTGLYVAPGFVNLRSHADLLALAEPALPGAVRQGIALEVLGHDGLGPAPLRAGDVEGRRRALARRLAGEVDWGFRSLASYLDALDQARPAIDLACLVPHGAIRDCVVGVADPASAHDLYRMKGLLARSLDEGAFGLSLLLPFGASASAALEELCELGAVVAARDLPLVAQPRRSGAKLLESLAELFAVGRASGAHVHVSGLSVRGPRGRSLTAEVVGAFSGANRHGVKATADASPATFRLAPLEDLFPPSLLDGGTATLRAGIAAEAGVAHLLDRLRADPGVDRLLLARPEGIRLFSAPAGRTPPIRGSTLKQAAGGGDPLRLALALLAEQPGLTSAVIDDLGEEALDELARLPFVSLSAGGTGDGRPAPGPAQPSIALSRAGGERRAPSLSSLVRKLSGQPADSFGLADHGYLLVGRRANAVAFDAEALGAADEPGDPGRAAPGIRHVLVGGKPVVLDGALTGERPGRVIRRGRR